MTYVMFGRTNGARRRGRPRQRWLDTLVGYSSGATNSNVRRYARDRAGWRGAATDVARSRMRLDGTRNKGKVTLTLPLDTRGGYLYWTGSNYAKISQIHFSRKFPPAKITCYTVLQTAHLWTNTGVV